MTATIERRHFLLGITAAGCTNSSSQSGGAIASPSEASPTGEEPSPPSPSSDADASTQPGMIPRRTLGSTGQQVSALGLGGFHIGKPSEAEATAIMHRAIDEGITFFDNCWDYHDGDSEVRMGNALRGGKRDQVFLMSKIDGRTKTAAALQIDASLKRLLTDHVDLMQIHEVIRERDPAWVFGEDGAIAALREAQQAGKVRFIGFTGHKSPDIHLSMLALAKKHSFVFDAVQMPLNVLDPHYDSFEKRVLPVLLDEGIGVLGMKPFASGAALKSDVQPEECLRYAMSLPTSVVITGCEKMNRLEQSVRVGRPFRPLSAPERHAILQRTQKDGKDGHLEGFKTGESFDATSRNEHWLTTGHLSFTLHDGSPLPWENLPFLSFRCQRRSDARAALKLRRMA